MIKELFQHKQVEEAKEAQKTEADYRLAESTISPQQITSLEEQEAAERRNILVQLTQWQQNRKPAMRDLFLKLSGYEIGKKGILQKVSWDEGYLSLMGAAKVVNFIEPLDHNIMLGNWDTKNIIVTVRDAIAHPLRRYLFMNHESMGLKIEHAEYVFWNVINTVEANYWRGWNNGERNKDSKITKVNVLENPYFQQKKAKGIFGMES